VIRIILLPLNKDNKCKDGDKMAGKCGGGTTGGGSKSGSGKTTKKSGGKKMK